MDWFHPAAPMIAGPGRSGKAGVQNEALVARQPIYEAGKRTFAYELLFRNSENNSALINDPDRATAQVIVNSFFGIGFDTMVGASPAFINVTEDFILADYCRSLPKDRIVFEILENAEPTP